MGRGPVTVFTKKPLWRRVLEPQVRAQNVLDCPALGLRGRRARVVHRTLENLRREEEAEAEVELGLLGEDPRHPAVDLVAQSPGAPGRKRDGFGRPGDADDAVDPEVLLARGAGRSEEH